MPRKSSKKEQSKKKIFPTCNAEAHGTTRTLKEVREKERKRDFHFPDSKGCEVSDHVLIPHQSLCSQKEGLVSSRQDIQSSLEASQGRLDGYGRAPRTRRRKRKRKTAPKAPSQETVWTLLNNLRARRHQHFYCADNNVSPEDALVLQCF
jgi:hypothetical protein